MKRWLKVTILLGLFVAIAACKPSGNLQASISILPTPTPVSLLQSPLATPTAASLAVPITAPTATPIPTATPMTVPPPPPNWPTGEPWPPKPNTPQPTIAPKPFAAPAFRSVPQGTRPANLQNIWYPYFPDLGSLPQLRAVQMDGQGQRWGQSDRLLNIDVPKPELGPDPGPILVDLHVSSNSRWMVTDFAYVGSQLIDLSSGKLQSLVSDSSISSWSFLAWTPDSQRILVAADKGILLLDPISREYETINFPAKSGPNIDAVAYSPDGKQIADALVYPATVSKPKFEIEIGIRSGEQGTRSVLLRLPGDLVAKGSLCWSSDGHRLFFIADVTDTGRHTQLWMIDMLNGTSQMLTQLGEGIQYGRPPAVWSPDGQSIVFLKDNNIYLLNPTTGKKQPITPSVEGQIQRFAWSPDGRWLAFSVSKGDYDEIWATNLDGTQQYPVAGPAVPNAPFVWLP